MKLNSNILTNQNIAYFLSKKIENHIYLQMRMIIDNILTLFTHFFRGISDYGYKLRNISGW